MRLLSWFSPFVSTAKSVLPLAVLLALVQLLLLRRPLSDVKATLMGLLLTVVGLHLFMKGAAMSLVPMGEGVGRELFRLSRPGLIALVGFFVGYAATLVEPALRDVVRQVEDISVGVIRANIMLNVVACGFGLGMALGLWRLAQGIGFLPVIMPVLALVLLGVLFVPSPYGALALDAAAATTGPVNIPVNMALALGLASSLSGIDPLIAGFGLVGLTAASSSLSVLFLGLLSRLL